MDYTIRNASVSDIPLLVDIIRSSFADVAIRFGLTASNCPRHPSNCNDEWISLALKKGVRYFLLEADAVPCGCVALEHPRPGVCYLERLAVLPAYRRRGLGRALVDHALSEAKPLGTQRVEIGIIADHAELKHWYQRIGFAETKRATYPHLPFEVLFMAMPGDVSNGSPNVRR